MPLDPKAKQFLGEAPQVSKLAATRVAEYRSKEIIERAGTFYEDLLGFFLEQKKKGDYMDEESIAAVALFTINLREAYGRAQSAEEKATWTDAHRKAKLDEFDTICEAMQAYYDENA
jgi:hypothetical protein